MKFEKMVINLTLLFLVMIAISVIGFLSIDSLLVNPANGYMYEYDRYYDEENARGYTLTIEVSASSCGATASVTPQIINPNRFNSDEDTKDWFGTAFCNVQRDAYTKVVMKKTNPSYKVGRGLRETYVQEEEVNKGTDPHNFDIQAQVKITQAFVGTINIPGGGTGTLTISGGFDLDAINSTITYQHQGKSVTRVVVKVIKNEIVKTEDSYGRSATVDTEDPAYPPVDCQARAEGITFKGTSYGNRSEEYRNGFVMGVWE